MAKAEAEAALYKLGSSIHLDYLPLSFDCTISNSFFFFALLFALAN